MGYSLGIASGASLESGAWQIDSWEQERYNPYSKKGGSNSGRSFGGNLWNESIYTKNPFRLYVFANTICISGFQ